jgi:anti-sigma factor RsiW
VRCGESVRVQAHFDGELDVISSLDLEKHVEHCAECGDLLHSLERTRRMLRRGAPEFQASPELRKRIGIALDRAERSASAQRPPPARRFWALPAFWFGGLTGAGAALAAAAGVFSILMLPATNPVVDDVLAAHVASLQSAHLIDVVSTDRHTVKPWFAGRVEVSPTVADFATQGYQLAGGRVDPLKHRSAAVLVYRHGSHVINVFCWAASRRPLPVNSTSRGYHLAFWKSGDLAYAAVSDTGWDELLGLERLIRIEQSTESAPARE